MENKRTTAPVPSAPTEGGQPPYNEAERSITEETANRKKNLRGYCPDDLRTMTMSQVYEEIYRGSPSVVEGLLCGGMYLLAGAPKIGKSFLVMQLAYHISTGKPLWRHEVRSGSVLYLALEDNYGRLQHRLYTMFGVESGDHLYLSVWSKKLGQGLEEQLKKFLREHPDTRLIVIDTLQKACETGNGQYSYSGDYEIISTLKHLAESYGVCILAVHHTRKQQADDRFDMISGTNGLLGAADGALLLQKEKRTDNHATLDITGRDQPDQRLYLLRNEETLSWELEREETELWKAPPDPILSELAGKVTNEYPEWSGTPTELTAFLGVDMMPNKLTQHLNIHVNRLLNEYSILYESRRSHDGRWVKLTYQSPA